MKKNISKIPPHIRKRLNAFDSDDVVVACVKRLAIDDLGRYAHLGISYQAPDVVLPPPAVPPAKVGRYSKTNVEGREVIRKDLPKTTKTFSFEAPNYGDWSKGSHTVSHTREVYHRDFIAPKELELSIELLPNASAGRFHIKFAIEQVIAKAAPDFDADLLYNLNLLQENVGAVDVFPSAATLADYTKTVQLAWEILPPGSIDVVVRRMLENKRAVTDDQRRTMEERLAVFSKFSPMAYLAGTSGFLRYFGAQFKDDLVVFENLTYGNALYVMRANWQTLSKRSRIELLKGPRDDFDRIEHRQGWEEALRLVLQTNGIAPTGLFTRRRRR
jgi:hypothetical protein